VTVWKKITSLMEYGDTP